MGRIQVRNFKYQTEREKKSRRKGTRSSSTAQSKPHLRWSMAKSGGLKRKGKSKRGKGKEKNEIL
jgi:hypothetical protein